jgi:hypothetical protein
VIFIYEMLSTLPPPPENKPEGKCCRESKDEEAKPRPANELLLSKRKQTNSGEIIAAVN